MTVKVYFRTSTAALGFRIALGQAFHCSQPQMAIPPREGRGTYVEVRTPAPPFASRNAEARNQALLVSVARRYDGIIIDTQDNREIS